jgi:hypothetical protein
MATHLDIAWNASTLIPPMVKLMEVKKKFFLVMDDNSSVVTVISKSKVVYAIAKSMLKIKQTEENIDYYELTDFKYLKVISCTENTAIKPRQLFIQDSLLKYI